MWSDLDVSTEDGAGLLRAANLRVTGPRVAVLEVLSRLPHAPVEAIIRELRETSHTVSHQAVYDVLAALTTAGLVRRIEPAGHSARYERRTGDNHHHVVCRSCARVEDVDCVVGQRPCLEASDDLGFVLDEAEVTWWGLCPDCAAAPPAT